MAEDLVTEHGTGQPAALEHLERRKDELDEAWKRKLADREEKAAAREAQREEERDPSQNVDAFLARFKELAAEVDGGLALATEQSAAADGLSRADLSARMAGLVEEVSRMQGELAAATLYLPPYDVRQSSDRIAKLSAAIEKARTELAPRKKFSFKKKTALAKTADPEPASASAPAVPATAGRGCTEELAQPRAAEALLEKMSLDRNELLVSDKHDSTLAVDHVGADQDVRFLDVSGCEIKVLHQSGSVRFINLRNCRVYIGPVAGSCFFENCHECQFYIASRQVRIHDSTSCDFYLHVLSRPIFEHCSKLRFAPYLLDYSSLAGQLEAAGLDAPRAAECWRDVDDFRWLRQQQSPNWCILPEAERVEHKL